MKTVIIVVILILTGVLAVVGLRAAKTYLGGAAGGAEPTGVRAQADAKSATISWQTEKESQGVVEYGTTPASLLLRALGSQPTTAHRVVLSPLKEETTYYFRIRVGETIHDNNGIPYSFKTTGGAEVVSPTEAVVPTVPVVEPTVPIEEPTEATSGGTKVTTCVAADFKDKFGTSNSEYDLDDNGTVNSKDWIDCLKNQ